MAKYIFVTGGVTSSLGKGIVSASVGKLLQARGLKVTIQKFDPYINVDPDTLNPYEHGECYVTDDGAVTDLDLGHYERFLNTPTSQKNNVTTGRIYQTVIQNERKGLYHGKTVQIIPHITNEIKRRMMSLEKEGYDIIITELGGTVGDIESLPYVESVRQIRNELGSKDAIVMHLTLIPFLSAAKELKTKPTQHSVKELQKNGVQPDMLICRTEYELNDEIKDKLSRFCNVDRASVIEAMDAKTIYDVPSQMNKQEVDEIILKKFGIENTVEPDLSKWEVFTDKVLNPKHEVSIGLIGKYVELQDAYKSIHESFIHAGAVNDCKVNIVSIHSEHIEEGDASTFVKDLDGILVAPGFGNRGIEGKIDAIEYVRKNNIPFFGICLGMQLAAIEFARNVIGHKNANSIEMDEKTDHPVISLMDAQKKIIELGGTMRLGSYPCKLTADSMCTKIYGSDLINERHRHRYEFNNDYLSVFNEKGFVAKGVHEQTSLVEILELKNHPWFIGVQFHPELKSTVENPHPLFVDFVKNAMLYRANGNASTIKEKVSTYS